MYKLVGLAGDGCRQLKRALARSGERQFLNRQISRLRIRIGAANQLLLEEYEGLIDALKNEVDPIERYAIMTNLTKLEVVFEKWRAIEWYYRL